MLFVELTKEQVLSSPIRRIASKIIKGTGANTELRKDVSKDDKMKDIMQRYNQEFNEPEIPKFLIEIQNKKRLEKWGHL
ncbi:MAG TPA: hypothetical protein VK190_03315 [Pseudoneobacillus sp.]|nr:hypothetical protein [Pseudoneobacillus sp.]